MKLLPFWSMRCIVLSSGLCLLLMCAIASGQDRATKLLEYKLDELKSEETRKLVDELNQKLAGYPEGCSREADKAASALWKALASDGSSCGLAVRNVFRGQGVVVRTLSGAVAIVKCTMDLPEAFREHAKGMHRFQECSELKKLADKYEESCKGKDTLTFAIKDTILCYDLKKGQSLVYLDFKNHKVYVQEVPQLP